MEGDAGAGRLIPADAEVSSSSKVKSEDSSDSEVGTDQTSSKVKSEDSWESEVGTEQAGSEESAEVTETKAEDGEQSADVVPEPADEAVPASAVDEGSRLGRRWFIGIAAALLLLAAGLGAGGYFALRFHHESQAIARNDVAALRAAQDCVAATQAPDIAAIRDSEQKIIDCATGDFRAQAVLYSGLLVEAYQAANAHVQVSNMRMAVERNNGDGSVDVLVALRVKVSNAEAKDQESGYRLRVRMAPDQGQYRIAKLDQVAK
jgi:Mce-associated membrane protein